MPLSNYAHQALLNSLFGKTSNFGVLASVPTFYVALSTTLPTMAGANVTEPANGYARVATDAADWVAATNADPSVVENANEIAFPAATGAQGTLAYMALYDALTSGNFLGFATLSVSRSPLTGDVVRFVEGELTVDLRSPA